MGTEQVVEEALEVAEQTMDALEAVPDDLRAQFLTIGLVVGVGIGGAVAYLATRKFMKAKYETIIEEEVAQAKEFYKVLYKEGKLSSPTTVRESDADNESLIEAAQALRDYQGVPVNKDDEEPVTVVRVEPEVDFDLDEEMRRRTEDTPYIIHEDEFMVGQDGFRQTQLTYYAGDDTLADEEDKLIVNPEPIVGKENLNRFGHGTNDPRIVFVRNERLSIDFEISLSDGLYSHEVLGLEHSDGGSRARRLRSQPRRKIGDER